MNEWTNEQCVRMIFVFSRSYVPEIYSWSCPRYRHNASFFYYFYFYCYMYPWSLPVSLFLFRSRISSFDHFIGNASTHTIISVACGMDVQLTCPLRSLATEHDVVRRKSNRMKFSMEMLRFIGDFMVSPYIPISISQSSSSLAYLHRWSSSSWLCKSDTL